MHYTPRVGAGQPKGRIRVLVVDDEPSICRAMEMMLGRAGYDVVCVLRGESGLARLQTEHFDVLVLDLRIPDERGDTVFHHAVGLQPHLRDATLFTTGDITDIAQTLIAACKCPVVMKPFEIRDVLAWVEALAPRRQDASA
ncbi:MAG TPA: response regulator [Gemmatimonadaceae bacterium]|nr:response regulator [Gemmatimonadaceae bacterium]